MKNEENLSNIPLPLLPYIGLAVDSDTVEIIRMRMSKSDDSCGQGESETLKMLGPGPHSYWRRRKGKRKF